MNSSGWIGIFLKLKFAFTLVEWLKCRDVRLSPHGGHQFGAGHPVWSRTSGLCEMLTDQPPVSSRCVVSRS